MSAICALYRHDDRPIEGESIERMLGAMRSWGTGPDGVWLHGSGRVGLGSRLMRVTPEDSFDEQPARSRDGTTVLVADARIDNRPELAAELGLARADAADMPDSGYILAAWEAWGTDTPAKLIGDFAFVIHDERREMLFCARDPLGQRVLFQHRGPGRLAVASTIPSLLALPDVVARLNEQKIAELLVLLEDSESTCFAGVTRLAPGHTLIATREGIRQQRYWSPDPERRLVLGSDDEYLEAFRSVFRRAVRDRLRSAGPVATMVSAGLDSSSVAGMAADVLLESGGRLQAFHAAPRSEFAGSAREGWVNDESAEVRALAAMHDNIDLVVLRGQDGTPLEDADRLFEVLCSPVRNSINLTWVRQIYDAAGSRGASVMLNGGKGNITISYTGLRSITDNARRGRLITAVREARAVAAARGHRPRDVIRDEVLLPLIPASVLASYARLRNGRQPPIREAGVSAIRPEFAQAMHVDEIARDRLEDETSMARASGAEYRFRVLAAGGDGFDVAHSLRGLFPIETREAPTDLRVVEFCLAIPGSQYLRNGSDRLLIRNGMRSLVPPSILDRTTRGSQAADWPVWFGRMRQDMINDVRALRDIELARRCLDLDRMQGLLDRWPDRFGPEHLADYGLLLLRGIMMGRFIRWFEARWS
jgi:asparagine synthase (glutamine-hydrolysing)